IVYSQNDGTYQDSFRLSTSYPSGRYSIFVTAHKLGYQDASAENGFWASIEEGFVMLKIVGHSLTLGENDLVSGILNVTLHSDTITSIEVTNRLMVLDPEGKFVYDNFLGIGGIAEEKRTPILNASISTINFEFSLQSPKLGYYTNLFLVYDVSSRSIQDSTPWSPAFLYTSPPVYIENLGTLFSQSSISTSTEITLQRFEAVKFSFMMADNTTEIMINIGASSNSKFQISLKKESLEIQEELSSSYFWALYNIPSGQYNLTVTALSNTAFINGVSISSSESTVPSVEISKVQATSFSATPGGEIGYYLTVEWNITQTNTINVTAEIEGNVTDYEEYQASLINRRSREFYLSVALPHIAGTYSITFTASLISEGISTQTSIPLEVQENLYNITISPSIEYYRMPSTWEWIWGARGPINVDSSELVALSITNIKIVDIGIENGHPVNATIEFQATNKAGGGWLSFGEGPHYDIWIKDIESEFQIGVIFAGDTEKRYATLAVDPSRNLSFTIKYKISWPAEIMLLVSSVFETVISAADLGLTGVVLDAFLDIVKLIALYSYKMMTEVEHGYMVLQDIANFLKDYTISNLESVINFANKAYYKNGRNPWLAILSAIIIFALKGEIDIGTSVNALVRLFIWAVYKSAANWYKVYEFAVEKALHRYQRSLTATWKHSTKEFIKKLGVAFSVVHLLKILYDLLTKPQEEGKTISSQLDTNSGITFDPIISIGFEGLTAETSIDYFGDTKQLSVHTAKTGTAQDIGSLTLEVDPNMTSVYLPIVSDLTYQRNVFRSCGLNATSTKLIWENGSNTFLIQGNGTMYDGLTKLNLDINQTWIKGFQEMSAEAVQNGTTALLNCSLLYPFGKNLTYSINVTLPENSTIIEVISNKNYTIQGNIISWSTPVDWFTVEFTPPSVNIAVAQVTLAKTIIGQGIPVGINVTVENQGVSTETFNVTIYGNTT
ncbi:MAG: hypothetical protein ACTSR2_11150, partial [Candidatus Hodarchaeales archaeon]